MMVAGIMNLMSQDLHVSEAVVGQLVTLYALTFAICGPLLVKLTHRFSSRSVLLWTLIVFIFGNGMIAIAPHFGIIVVGRIFCRSFTHYCESFSTHSDAHISKKQR